MNVPKMQPKSQLLNQDTLRQTICFLVMFVVFMVLTASPAFADLAGGLGKAKSTLIDLKDWIIAVVFIGSIIYILWKAVENWRNRGDWGDFFSSVGHVAIAGAAPAIANWAWTAFH